MMQVVPVCHDTGYVKLCLRDIICVGVTPVGDLVKSGVRNSQICTSAYQYKKHDRDDLKRIETLSVH